MSETTDCQRNNDVILNRAKDYYKNDKERLRDKKQKKNTKIYQKKKKNKKREYGRNRYHTMSKE